jgi:hypothetical protein
MADVKISELPTKTVAATDIVPVVDSAATTTSQVTAGDIAAIGGGPPATHASTHATGGGDDLTPADIGAAETSHATQHRTGQSDAITPVIVTPASLSSNQANYSPGACDILRLSSSTAIDITGLSSTPVADGSLRLIINTNSSGGATITLKHESINSVSANRFRNSAGGDYTLAADGGSAVLTYSTAISRWRIL